MAQVCFDGKEPRWLRFVIAYVVLWPLIKRNKQLRKSRILPDQWYWADVLAARWGYFFK